MRCRANVAVRLLETLLSDVSLFDGWMNLVAQLLNTPLNLEDRILCQ